MIIVVKNYSLLEECMKDILSVIKPTEEDQNKRLGAINEIVNLVGALRGVGAFRGNFSLCGYHMVLFHHFKIQLLAILIFTKGTMIRLFDIKLGYRLL
jgi:hypothetical protein